MSDIFSETKDKLCIKKPTLLIDKYAANPFLRFLNEVIFYALFLLVPGILAYLGRRQFDTIFVMLYFLILLICYLLYNSFNGSLPFATTPLPPHLGLDGISNEVRASY